MGIALHCKVAPVSRLSNNHDSLHTAILSVHGSLPIQYQSYKVDFLKQEDNDNAADPLIPNRQLAEILDLRPKSLQYYRKKKILEAVVIQRRVFFRQSVVKKFLAEHFNQKDKLCKINL